MDFEILIEHKAEEEILRCIDYYNNILNELGWEFLTELNYNFHYLSQYPYANSLSYKSLRKLCLKRFPFIVYYSIEGNAIHIEAVFDCRRGPDTLSHFISADLK